MVAPLELSGLLLVFGGARYWQVIGFHLGQKLLKVLVCLHIRSDLGLATYKELYRHRGCLVDLTLEPDRHINSEHVAWRVHLVDEPIRENAVSLVHVQLEQGVEAVPAPASVERELRE